MTMTKLDKEAILREVDLWAELDEFGDIRVIINNPTLANYIVEASRFHGVSPERIIERAVRKEISELRKQRIDEELGVRL